MTVKEIADKILVTAPSKKPVFIAIEGYGGAGKTTFAQHLKEQLIDAYVIAMDDFIVKENLNDSTGEKLGFDRQRLEHQVLRPASDAGAIEYQKLLWDSNTLGPMRTVPDSTYLIIEGISSYHLDIADYYDYKIWVDTPLEVAKVRGRARDAGNENESKWDVWAASDLKYQQKYKPELVADFIFSDSQHSSH